MKKGATTPDADGTNPVGLRCGYARREWALLAGFAILPFVRALALWSRGWVLIGDNANIAIRSQDVGTRSTPLLGMPSGLVQFVPASHTTHPGPLVFWVIGPWVRVFGHHTLSVLAGTAAVGAASSVAILWCARRLAGRTGLVVGAVVLVVLIVGTPYNMFQPLNPVIAFLPALAALIAAACVVDGDDASVPILVAAGSFAAQADVAYVLMIAFVFIAVAGSRAHRRFGAGTVSPKSRAWMGLGLAVLAGCWIGPLVDVGLRRGGNVVATLQATRSGQLQPQGLPAMVAALRGLANPLGALPALPADPPSGVGATVLSTIGVAAAVFIIRTGLRDDRSVTVAFIKAGGAATAGMLIMQALTPAAAGRQTLYLLPVVVSGAMIWLGILALGGRALRRRTPAEPVPTWVAVGTVLIATAAIATRLSLEPASEPGSAAVGELTAQVRKNVTPRPLILVRAGGPTSQSVLRGVGFYLEGNGYSTYYSADQVNYVGAKRTVPEHDDRFDRLLITRRLRNRVPASWRRVARWHPPGVDVGELQSLRERVAAELRISKISLSHQSGSSQIGQILAASKRFDAAALLDDDLFRALGDDVLQRPSTLQDLPNDTLATLVEEHILRTNNIDQALLTRFEAATEEDELELWLVPSASR